MNPRSLSARLIIASPIRSSFDLGRAVASGLTIRVQRTGAAAAADSGPLDEVLGLHNIEQSRKLHVIRNVSKHLKKLIQAVLYEGLLIRIRVNEQEEQQ